MKKHDFILCLQVLATGLLSRQNEFPKLTGPYFGQKPPGDTTRPFAPAFSGSMFTSFLSGIILPPDGNSSYWQGMLNDGSKGQAIFESRADKGFRTRPSVAQFSEPVAAGGDDSLFISPAGEKLFFLSTRPPEKSDACVIERIWVAGRIGKGCPEPELLPLIWDPSNGKYLFRRHGINQLIWIETSLIEKFKPGHNK